MSNNILNICYTKVGATYNQATTRASNAAEAASNRLFGREVTEGIRSANRTIQSIANKETLFGLALIYLFFRFVDANEEIENSFEEYCRPRRFSDDCEAEFDSLPENRLRELNRIFLLASNIGWLFTSTLNGAYTALVKSVADSKMGFLPTRGNEATCPSEMMEPVDKFHSDKSSYKVFNQGTIYLCSLIAAIYGFSSVYVDIDSEDRDLMHGIYVLLAGSLAANATSLLMRTINAIGSVITKPKND